MEMAQAGEISFMAILRSNKDELNIIALQLFEETLKLKVKISEIEKNKERELHAERLKNHDLNVVKEKKNSQIDLLKLSRFNSNSSKFF